MGTFNITKGRFIRLDRWLGTWHDEHGNFVMEHLSRWLTKLFHYTPYILLIFHREKLNVCYLNLNILSDIYHRDILSLLLAGSVQCFQFKINSHFRNSCIIDLSFSQIWRISWQEVFLISISVHTKYTNRNLLVTHCEFWIIVFFFNIYIYCHFNFSEWKLIQIFNINLFVTISICIFHSKPVNESISSP